MLNTIAVIIGITSGLIVVIVVIIGIAKSGFNVFSKINKIDNIDKATNALLIIHRNELFELYKDQIRIVFNPVPNSFADKDYLLERNKIR